MQTSLKTGFAQNFLVLPKKSSCPKFGGLQPPSPRTPMLSNNCYASFKQLICTLDENNLTSQCKFVRALLIIRFK